MSLLSILAQHLRGIFDFNDDWRPTDNVANLLGFNKSEGIRHIGAYTLQIDFYNADKLISLTHNGKDVLRVTGRCENALNGKDTGIQGNIYLEKLYIFGHPQPVPTNFINVLSKHITLIESEEFADDPIGLLNAMAKHFTTPAASFKHS